MSVMPSTIRVSLGSASLLGFKKLKYDFEIKVVYLLLTEKCNLNCKYCTQAKNSKTPDKFLSRVVWPEFDFEETLERILEKKEQIERVCIQTVNNNFTKEAIFKILERVGKEIRVSVSINTNSFKLVEEIFDLNADRVGLPIDVANEALYKDLRGGDFNRKLSFILKVSDAFKNKISTHIIVGLGESDLDILNLYKKFFKIGVTVALFSFTPIEGTYLEKLSPPNLIRYRKIQIATKLIERGYEISNIEFDENGFIKNIPNISLEILKNLNPFITRGCPYCTRPYYNERPKGDLYNYPFELSEEDLIKEYVFLKTNKVL